MRPSILIVLLSVLPLFAQTNKIKGIILDSTRNEPLGYASIRVSGTNYGTAANIDGEFSLELNPGNYTLVFTYIGYRPDSIKIKSPPRKTLEIGLLPQPVTLAEVVVNSEDPAYAIIREAIRRKKENRKGLENFEYDAYAKNKIYSAGVLATIEETFVKGYIKPGKWEKEIVKAIHKTRNMNKDEPPTDFTITNSYFVDFSADTVSILMNRVYLPIANNAFDYYDYKLIKTISTQTSEAYVIEVIPRSDIQPLLKGIITIDGESYALAGVELRNADGLRFPYINDLKVEFKQTLGKYEKYWLPNFVEYTTELSLNFSGLIGLELISLVKAANYTNYKINQTIPDSILGLVDLKIAGFTIDPTGKKPKPINISREKIDSLRPLPLTNREIIAYAELDSTKKIEKMIKTTGVLSGMVEDYSDEPDTSSSLLGSVSDGLTTYGYFRNNRVTGLMLGFRLNENIFGKNLNTRLFAGYSFHRKKVEGNFSLNYKFEKSFISQLYGSAYIFTKQWQNISPYPDILNSASVSLGFKDHFNYYQAEGFIIGTREKISDRLGINVEFNSEKQINSESITNPAFFDENASSLRANPDIIEGTDNKITLKLDYGDNPYEVNFTPRKGFKLTGDFSKTELGSGFDYTCLRFTGQIRTETIFNNLFLSPFIHVMLDAGIVNGDYGPQHLLSPPTALAFYSPFGSFKGLNTYEYAGSKYAALHIEHNWRTVVFQSLGLDFISDLHLDLITGASILEGKNDRSYLDENSFSKNPYWEVYASIARILGVLRADFAYTSKNTLVFRAATAVLF